MRPQLAASVVWTGQRKALEISGEGNMTPVTTAPAAASTATASRWVQLIFVIVCMVMIANLQYGWTLFVNPINKATGWSIAAIQFAYSIFIALETWLTPIQGWIVDV